MVTDADLDVLLDESLLLAVLLCVRALPHAPPWVLGAVRGMRLVFLSALSSIR